MENALIKNDITTLEKLYTDTFSWTNHMGNTCNKLENLLKTKCGNVQYISWVDEEMKINVINDNAVVKAKEVLKMVVYEQRVSIVRNIIATFQLQGDKWLLSKIE
ncbi:MAG: nuclear transport factor 2 family protein, partial [Bacteroidia bacterium]|nr:nuclear transport factor 2 family protein [Bacteroidia bacterium]